MIWCINKLMESLKVPRRRVSILNAYVAADISVVLTKSENCDNMQVVVQKLPQLSDTHFSQVLNKLEKKFFHGFIKYHLALHFI